MAHDNRAMICDTLGEKAVIGMAVADWEALKVAYATGEMSYRQMAEEEGLSASTLMKVGAKEGWAEARKKHRANVVAKAVRRVEERKANKLVRLQRSADAMTAQIEAVLGDEQQFYRHLVTEGSGPGEFVTLERQFDKVDTKALRDMVGAIKDMTAVMRNLYGLLTVPEQTAMDVAVARLKLDERKVSMGEVDESETGVVVIPAADEEGDDGEADQADT